MLQFVQSDVADISVLGCIEGASVVIVIYYIFSKIRLPSALIDSRLMNLNLSISCWQLLDKFNYLTNKILITIRCGGIWLIDNNKMERKLQSLPHGVGTVNMLELTPHGGRTPYRSMFDWGTYFPFVAQSIRSKKFQYPQVSGSVMKDSNFKLGIKQAAQQIMHEKYLNNTTEEDNAELPCSSTNVVNYMAENDNYEYQNILKRQENRAASILKDMRSTLNNFLLALTSWLMYKLLPCFLSGVVIHKQQIEMLKKISERNPGVPLIFMPLHRSHLDYVMVTFILTNNDIRSPLVAAGNNLQIPVFGGLLRGLGAFFIKRKIDPVLGKKDILYRAVLQIYLQHALKMGHNVEFFIEGGRTRTGKPCMPKSGILSVIVNAFMDRSISDALIVPVSLNYERLVDGNFVREQKGEKKVPETFTKAMTGIWKALNSNYGLMRIDFNEPYSIRELVNSYNINFHQNGINKTYAPVSRELQQNKSTSSLYGTDVICEEHRTLVDSISRQVVFDCAAATSVMSTNALSYLLLTRFRNGAQDKEIVKSFDDLRSTLKDHKELGFSGDSMHIIKYACDLLGKDLVIRSIEDDGNFTISPVQTIESFIELSYYSNTLTPHFALQSILLTSFHFLLTEVGNDVAKKTELPGVERTKLINTALENCDVFRYEYILNKPTQTLANNLELSLDELIMQGLLTSVKETEENTYSKAEGRKLAKNLDLFLDENNDDFDVDGFENINAPHVYLAMESIDKQHALCEVLAPCSHTYLAVADSLSLLHNNSMLESEFIKYIIKSLRRKIKSGHCPYAESISTDSIRNCLKLLEKWSVIEICNQNGLRLLCLCSLYESSTNSLKAIIQRIAETVPNYKNGFFK